MVRSWRVLLLIRDWRNLPCHAVPMVVGDACHRAVRWIQRGGTRGYWRFYVAIQWSQCRLFGGATDSRWSSRCCFHVRRWSIARGSDFLGASKARAGARTVCPAPSKRGRQQELTRPRRRRYQSMQRFARLRRRLVGRKNNWATFQHLGAYWAHEPLAHLFELYLVILNRRSTHAYGPLVRDTAAGSLSKRFSLLCYFRPLTRYVKV